MGLIRANDILSDVSFSLLQNPVYTTLTTNLSVGTESATVASITGIYNGAQLIVGSGANQEVVTASSVTSSGFTATFAHAHSIGDPVTGVTFPLGQTDHPLFTQPEMLAYLADAQKDYLLKTRLVFTALVQTISPGKYAPAPEQAIRVERIAINGCHAAIASISRSSGTVTVFFQESTIPACFISMATIVIENVPLGAAGTNFNGSFQVAIAGFTPYGSGPYGGGPYGGSANSVTYTQSGVADDTATPTPQSVASVGSFGALFNSNQTMLDLMVPSWPTQDQPTVPTTWFQDQANLATLGFYPPYQAGGPAEIWFSDRGADSIGLNDTLTVPDAFNHYIKFGILARAFSKDGEMRDPERAMYCKKRFDLGVIIGVRFMMGVAASLMKEKMESGRFNPMPVQQPVGVGG